MSGMQVVRMVYDTWSTGAQRLEPITKEFPLTTTACMTAFTILGFQYFAVNVYRLSMGVLFLGLSTALGKAIYNDFANFTMACKKSYADVKHAFTIKEAKPENPDKPDTNVDLNNAKEMVEKKPPENPKDQK